MARRSHGDSSGFSRRLLLAAGFGIAACGSLLEPRNARAGWQVEAAVDSADGARLREAPSRRADILATLDDRAPVELREGPDENGWYRVDALDRAGQETGWIDGSLLAFVVRVRAADDLPMLAFPGDEADEIATLRHGFVITLLGPDLGDWILVRSGERTGYVSAWALASTDDPETDPAAEWWVDVDRAERVVRLCVGDSVVDAFDAEVSADQGEGFYATAAGSYAVYQKLVGPTYTPYADAYFKNWAGFDPDRENGFHSWITDAEGNLLANGKRATAGCVATSPADAAAIFLFVEIGTRVEVHW